MSGKQVNDGHGVSMGMRTYYIDNLRWMSILLLIPYHAAMAWNAWGEPNYIYFAGSNLISSIVVFLSPYFMPLLFLIVGISTRFALEKRTVGQYVLERLGRLLLPFAFGTTLLMPCMTYIADKFHNGYTGNFFQHYFIFFTRFTDLTGADGGFSLGQFWFLFYLFFISFAAAGIILLQRKLIPEMEMDASVGLICFLGLPLPFLSEVLSIGGKSIVEYAYIFLAGYYIFSRDEVIRKAERYKWMFLCIGLAATLFYVYLFLWSDTQYALLNVAAKSVSEWFMMPALLGIGKRYLNFSGSISTYMSKRSFSFYIFHYIWVVLFQYVLSGICGNSTAFLYFMPVLLAYVATFLCCEICGGRYFPHRYVS